MHQRTETFLDRARLDKLPSGAWVVLDHGFLSVGNFLTAMLLARSESVEGFGIYTMAWSLIIAAASLNKALVHLPTTVFLPSLPDVERRGYLGSAATHSALLSLICLVCFSALYMWEVVNPETFASGVAPAIVCAALLVLPYLVRDCFRNILFADLEFTTGAIANVFGSGAQIGLVLILFMSDALTLYSAIATIFLGCSISCLFMWFDIRSEVRVRARRLFPDFFRNWGHGRWLILNALASTAVAQGLIWLLMLKKGIAEVALFGVSMALAGALAPLLRAVSSYFLPNMAHEYVSSGSAGVGSWLSRATWLLFGIFGIWLLVSSIWFAELVVLVYGEKYSAAGLVFLVLVVRVFFEGISMPMNDYFQSIRMPRVISTSLAVNCLVTLHRRYCCFHIQDR